MRVIEENYQRITDDRRSFDIHFWQSQGDRAIFEAVSEMLRDYFLIRGKDADEFRLQRTIESFRKALDSLSCCGRLCGNEIQRATIHERS